MKDRKLAETDNDSCNIKKQKNKKTQVAILILCGLLLLVIVALQIIGVWFKLADPIPEKVDVVMTFSGEKARESFTKELLLKTRCKYWLLSRPSYYKYDEKEFDKNLLGFDSMVIVDSCSNTHNEVKWLYNWIKNSNLPDSASIVMVSGPYHLRRISIIANYFNKKEKYGLSYIAVPDRFYSLVFNDKYFRLWWQHSLMRMELLKVINEFYRMIFANSDK